MTVCAVLGGQWGDEAKGKIVDVLAKDADIVARFSGGNNAGHTVINDEGEWIFHLVPCGVLWPNVQGYIGNGVVVAPDAFLDEVEEIEGRGIDIQGRVLISERSHLVMPYHVVMDNLFEAAKGDGAIGTTGRGIGPAYTDKASRIGVRAADLLDIESLYPRMEYILRHHNAVITEKVYGGQTVVEIDERVREVSRTWASSADAPSSGRSSTYVCTTPSIRRQDRVILEGRPGRAPGPRPRNVPVRHVIASRRSVERPRPGWGFSRGRSGPSSASSRPTARG